MRSVLGGIKTVVLVVWYVCEMYSINIMRNLHWNVDQLCAWQLESKEVAKVS